MVSCCWTSFMFAGYIYASLWCVNGRYHPYITHQHMVTSRTIKKDDSQSNTCYILIVWIQDPLLSDVWIHHIILFMHSQIADGEIPHFLRSPSSWTDYTAYIYICTYYICMSRIIFYPFDLHLGSIQPVNRRDGRCGKCLAQHPCAARARMLSLTGGWLVWATIQQMEISPANPLRSRTGFCYPWNVSATSYIPTSEIILVDGLNHQPDVFLGFSWCIAGQIWQIIEPHGGFSSIAMDNQLICNQVPSSH